MNKYFKLIIITILSIGGITSCLDDEKTDYGLGPVVVAFSESEISNNFVQDAAGTVYEYEIPVEYMGGKNVALDKEVTLEVGIADTSTAKNGVHVELVNNTITIPAGETKGTVTLRVKSAEFEPIEPLVATLEILSSSETVEYNNTMDVVLMAICSSELAGDYVYADGYGRDVTVVETGVGKYTVSADNYFGGEYSFNITDVCDEITITGGFLDDNYGIAVSGTGTVDQATGLITIVYTVDGYFSNRTMTLQPR